MNPVPRETDEKSKKAVEEFLAKGGVIQQIPSGQRSEEIDYKGSFYQRRKKKKEAETGE